MRDFRKLQIWNDGIEKVISTYQLTDQFPKEEIYGLCSQMQRASVSIPSNIAGGCSRNSDIEFKRFLEISMGSAFELETQTIIAQRLGYISEENLNQEVQLLNGLQKQINSLISKIKTDSNK
jgi:four helix bundle protein